MNASPMSVIMEEEGRAAAKALFSLALVRLEEGEASAKKGFSAFLALIFPLQESL